MVVSMCQSHSGVPGGSLSWSVDSCKATWPMSDNIRHKCTPYLRGHKLINPHTKYISHSMKREDNNEARTSISSLTISELSLAHSNRARIILLPSQVMTCNL